MRVGIDAGPLLGHGGISGYVGPLVRTLLTTDRETAYHLILRRGWKDHEGSSGLDRLAPVTRVRVPDRLLFSLQMPRALWGSPDLFLATCLVAPVLSRGQVISIVYDLIPLRLPELFADHGRFRSQLERLLGRSAALIAISQCTRRDLVEFLGVDPARVHVIYPGCSEPFRPVPPAKATEVARRLGIHGPYVLYVGALGPHKNVPTLLRAYERARLEGGCPARLVLVGSPRWGQEALAVLKALRVGEDVLFTGPVPTEELPALYSGAEVFIFPSRYEGFGLPVLEAMACGAPVIVSHGGALPEVVGEAGFPVDPDDEGALASAICSIVGDPATRARMCAAGLTQAARFSWARSAADLLVLFHEVARTARGSGAGSGRNGPGTPAAPPGRAFYNREYFEGKTRQSPPHTRDLIYPLVERTAAFLCRRCRPARVLDLGCAKGFLVEAFLAHGAAAAFGLDVSPYAVSAGGPAARGRLLVADVEAGIPLRASSCDLVTGLDLFEHLPDPGLALREIRRVLRDTGVAYLKICHPHHPNAQRDPSHINVQRLGYWHRQFRQAGFAWKRLYESDFTVPRGLVARLKSALRRWREWAVVGTPADYKFLLWKRVDGLR